MIIDTSTDVPDYTYGKKYNKENEMAQESGNLIIEKTPLDICIADIGQYENADYALLRKTGLGASDSSAVLGVNPYTSRQDLISEKCRTYLTEEEKGVGDKVAVRKGNELEPFVINKFQTVFGVRTIKPKDMYALKEFPFLHINFDGVTNTPDQYIPAEIKIVTTYGEKHYDKYKAFYRDPYGFDNRPEDVSTRNWSIQEKAEFYGIPPYYYTQLQQEMLCLDAPYGYLSSLWDREWRMYTYYVWRDEAVQHAIITEGYKVWQTILERRRPDWHITVGSASTSTEL